MIDSFLTIVLAYALAAPAGAYLGMKFWRFCRHGQWEKAYGHGPSHWRKSFRHINA